MPFLLDSVMYFLMPCLGVDVCSGFFKGTRFVLPPREPGVEEARNALGCEALRFLDLLLWVVVFSWRLPLSVTVFMLSGMCFSNTPIPLQQERNKNVLRT